MIISRIHVFLQINGLGREYDKNYLMEDSAETIVETVIEWRESEAENKPQRDLSTTLFLFIFLKSALNPQEMLFPNILVAQLLGSPSLTHFKTFHLGVSAIVLYTLEG